MRLREAVWIGSQEEILTEQRIGILTFLLTVATCTSALQPPATHNEPGTEGVPLTPAQKYLIAFCATVGLSASAQCLHWGQQSWVQVAA